MNLHKIKICFSASFLSAITLLGMPAEVYTQVGFETFRDLHFISNLNHPIEPNISSKGTQFLTVLVFIPVTALVVTQVYIPVFHRLQVGSFV